MAVPIDHDVIEQTARAIFGQMSPITGTRGTGAVLLVNDTDDPIVVPKNMYLLPRLGTSNELRDELVFKTKPNPATLEEHGVGGDWTIPPHDSLEVGIQSNLGGTRHNLPAGTVFLWDPPLSQLVAECSLVADITDGAEKTDDPVVRAAVYYEDLASNRIAEDMHKGRLRNLPAVALTWEQSTPIEGRASGANQGATRKNDTVRMFSEHYKLFVIVSEYSSDKRRRGNGLRVVQALTRLLTDQVTTRDFERITNMGSLEILGRARFSRDERHYVYVIPFRLSRSMKMLEDRTFTPFLKARVQASLPGHDAPEPTTRLELVDETVTIPS